MAGKKSIHGNVGKKYIKSYSKEKGYEYFKNKAEHDKAISKANKKATYKLLDFPTGKVAKKAGKSVAKKALKSIAGKLLPPVGAALAATEVYKAGKKGLRDRKYRKSCEKKGGVWQKGYCITRSSKKKK